MTVGGRQRRWQARLIVGNSNSNTVSVLLNTTMPGATTASFAAQQTIACSDPNNLTSRT